MKIKYFLIIFIFLKIENKSKFFNYENIRNLLIVVSSVYLGIKYDKSRNEFNKINNEFLKLFNKNNASNIFYFNDYEKCEIDLKALNKLKDEIDQNLKKNFYFFHNSKINELIKNINICIEINEFFKYNIKKDYQAILEKNNDTNEQKVLIEKLIKKYEKRDDRNHINYYKIYFSEYLKNFKNESYKKEKEIENDKNELKNYINKERQYIENLISDFYKKENKIKIIAMFIEKYKDIIKEIEETIEVYEHLKNEEVLKNFKIDLNKIFNKSMEYLNDNLNKDPNLKKKN